MKYRWKFDTHIAAIPMHVS